MLAGHILKEDEQEIAVFPIEHDCSEFTVLTSDNNEMVCIRCGRVDEEGMREYLSEIGVTADAGKRSTSTDHNPGNALLNSSTEQNGYVSKANPGVTLALNNPRGKDAAGKKIKPQLKDPYKAGLVGDPSKGCHTQEDILTGKTSVVFSRYDLPILQIMKEKALKKCVDLHLDTVEQTLVAKKLRRIYSNLFIGPMIDYAVLAAVLKNNRFLSVAAKRD